MAPPAWAASNASGSERAKERHQIGLLALAQLDELCTSGDNGSRAVILMKSIPAACEIERAQFRRTRFDNRDEAIAILGPLDEVGPSIEVTIRRRA
jgi:hypothetical protein